MSARKSQFLSAFGKAFQVFKAITDAVLEAGGDDTDVGRILTDKALCQGIATQIVKSKLKPSPETPKLDKALRILEEKKEAVEGPQREYAHQLALETNRAVEELLVYGVSEEGKKAKRFLELSQSQIEKCSGYGTPIQAFMVNSNFDFSDHQACLFFMKWWQEAHFGGPLEFLPTFKKQIEIIADIIAENNTAKK